MCQAQPKAQLQVIVQVQTAPPSPPVPPPGAGGRCVRHRKPLAPALHTAKARNSRTARKPRGLIKWLPRASARHWGSNFSPGAGSTGALDPHHCQSTAPCSCRAHSETPRWRQARQPTPVRRWEESVQHQLTCGLQSHRTLSSLLLPEGTRHWIHPSPSPLPASPQQLGNRGSPWPGASDTSFVLEPSAIPGCMSPRALELSLGQSWSPDLLQLPPPSHPVAPASGPLHFLSQGCHFFHIRFLQICAFPLREASATTSSPFF